MMITVRYTQNEQWLRKTMAARRQLHPLRFYLRYALILLLIAYPLFYREMISLLPCIAGLFLLAFLRLRDYRAGKEILRGPNGGKEGIFRFSEERVELKIGDSKTEFPIGNLKKVKIIPLGLAIYPSSRIYQLIPRDSFETEEEMRTILGWWEAARAKPGPSGDPS